LEDQTKEESSNIEDNLPMVNYIMLHRIYDMLALISNKLVGGEETEKMIQYHKEGFLLGPDPAFTAKEEI
jgi:hypothetical protein